MMVAPMPLPAGLTEPAIDSQAIFRALLDALSRPGRIKEIGIPVTPPPPLTNAAAAVGLAMFDLSTPVWVDPHLASPGAVEYLTFHTGCPLASDPQAAAFAILDGSDPIDDFSVFAQGTPEYPDRSATLIFQVQGLAEGVGVRLTGPGIETEHRLTVDGVLPVFWRAIKNNTACFPLGVDVILTNGSRVACLPRTTKVEA